ncbi:MAG: hypothetical protein K8J08_06570 [Thermoanaerobaculia bacterium]|nr:hypothetical protein [Thermoanaerobaculia bacterium]
MSCALRSCPGRVLAVALLLAASGLSVSPAVASDGVVEINQVRAEVGGVTPGDGPGFPVVLSQPGSYRLTSNLDVRGATDPANTTAIQVSTDGVSIDLGGFAILGPVICTPDGNIPNTVTCVPSGGSGHGIEAGSPSGPTGFTNSTRVSNGSIHGMGGSGIYYAFEARDVVAVSNGGAGISGYSVFSSQAHRNGSLGIFAVLVTDSLAILNGNDGVNSAVARSVVSSQNGNAGIVGQLAEGSLAVANVYGFSVDLMINSSARANDSFGYYFPSLGGAYGSSNFSDNNGGAAQTDGGTELGPSLCEGNTTCP